jgi:hypothetical protein
VSHRCAENVRQIEKWCPRLRTHAPWLDGQKHAPRDPDADRKLRFVQSAPFAPVVLQAAQAVIDSVHRHRRWPKSLPDLVERALSQGFERDPARLIPLDVLMAPMFGLDMPTGEQWPPLVVRARSVVQMLMLCPELSRGTKSLAVMLLSSLDHDFRRICADLERLVRPAKGVKWRRVSPHAEVELHNNSWWCREPLMLDGAPIHEDYR